MHAHTHTHTPQVSHQNQAKQVARVWQKSLSGGNILQPSDAASGDDGVTEGERESRMKEEGTPAQLGRDDDGGVQQQAERDR